ncbi:pgl [Symbiodinium sp. CCMP2456]|nr:pgl [Symbiodinium sp. CCMP2456]
MLLASGVGCFVASPRVGLYRVSPQRLRLSLKSVSFWQVASNAADAAKCTTGSYLQKINSTATAFLEKRDAVDREAAIANLSEQMTVRGTLCLVLGGRNLGKTLLKEAAIARCKANVNMVSVDMRDADMLGKDLMTALDLQRQKSLGWEVLDAAVSRHQIRIDNFISRSKKVPCIIVDEANLAIPGIVAEDGRGLAGSALQAITKWTKQTPRASVTMISSEFSYPFRLLANGLALSSIQQLLVIGEVPQSDMKKMLKDDWGMDEDLSKMFYDIFGGDIYTTKQALNSLIRKKDAFDPFAVLLCPGLPSCVKNAAARAHLANIATQGFSLVEDLETDEGAKMIAEKNLGGVISRNAITFGLPDIFNGTDKKWAVIPSTYHMKLLIHRELQQIPLPKSGRCFRNRFSCVLCSVLLTLFGRRRWMEVK